MPTQIKNASGSARATIDHDEIRDWVERHGGEPSIVKRTRGAKRDGESGILRIDFPGYSGEGSLEAISWEEFFERFEKANLAFLYQEKAGRGGESRFNKLVSRDSVATNGDGSASKRRAPQRKKRPATATKVAKSARNTGRSRMAARMGATSRSKKASKKASRKTGSRSRAKR